MEEKNIQYTQVLEKLDTKILFWKCKKEKNLNNVEAIFPNLFIPIVADVALNTKKD